MAPLHRIGTAGFLLLATLGLLVFQGWQTVRSSARRIGFGPEESAQGLVVARVTPGRPAARAGILPGDQVLEVEGHAIHELADYHQAAEELRRGQAARFIIRRGAQELELRVVPGVELPWAALLINALTALCYLGVALLVLQRLEDLRARLLFAFGLAVVVELALPLDVVGRPGLTVPAWCLYFLLTGLQMGLELHLASLIPERHGWLRRRPWAVPLYYAAGLGLGTAACATYLVEDVFAADLFPWSPAGVLALFLQVGMPVWALGVCLLLGMQALRYREPRGRHQAGLVLAGILPWFVFLLATTVLERTGATLPGWFPSLESLVLLCYPVALFAAIFRYHLFDIELVVRRSLVYTTLTGTLILLFYAALGAGGALFSSLVEEDSAWTLAAATLLLGLLFSPLRRGLQRVIDRRFFPERHELRRRLSVLARELPALGKLPRMGEHLVARLTEIFGARAATLLIADPETGLLRVLATSAVAGGAAADRPGLLELDDPAVALLERAHRALPAAQLATRSPAFARLPGLDAAGWVAPLFHQDALTGALAVGRKEGRRAYPAEELDLLNLLAHLVATVFENARLFESATYESLTGLLRREAILEQLDRELERALRYGRPLTVAMADLDHFKVINDSYGHLAGDALLQRMAQVLSESLRSSDRIGRYGGEEFLLVLPETDLAAAGRLAEKIRERVQWLAVPLECGAAAGATISIGLAALDDLARRGGAVTSRDLLAAADRSLYEAKSGGRNRVWPRVA